MSLLSDLFPAGDNPLGMILGDRILVTTSMTLDPATHEALAPKYDLYGWKVKPIGGGAGGTSRVGGYGGSAPNYQIVLNSGANVSIVVGSGGLGTNTTSSSATNPGGDSSFGNITAKGGPGVTAVSVLSTDNPLRLFQASSGANTAAAANTTFYVYDEGAPGIYGVADIRVNGSSSQSGTRGGGGGSFSPSVGSVGGCVYPHPNAFSNNTVSNSGYVLATPGLSGGLWEILVKGSGNPNTSVSAIGHTGIGDYPGGGGNSGGGNGGFPGGGGGGGSAASGTFGGNGGDGCVIIYPIFRIKLS